MRPQVRPNKPYSQQEIADHVYQHFFVEKNPQCLDLNGKCVYGQTGCAVGCLVTQQDAEIFDNSVIGNLAIGNLNISCIFGKYPEIIGCYFNNFALCFLDKLQKWHDHIMDIPNFEDFINICKEFDLDVSTYVET